MTNHERFEEAFKDREGETLPTSQIKEILLKKFPDMSAGSILPNDHGEGNKSPCWCAGTEKRIFDKVRERVYRVRRTTEPIPLEPKSIVEINKEYEDREQQTVTPTAQLWNSTIREYWESALSRYWNYVKPQNLNLEKELNNMNVKTITDIDDWYSFLLNKYFAWKYTSPSRYASTTKHFINAYENNRDELYRAIKRLFTFKKENIEDGLMVATTIKGLGTAGASGLLSLLFPNFFGTVDQFVVKALQEVKDLADSDKLQKMNPDSLTIPNGVILISIMREKAADLNSIFQTEYWTPRKIDMILWASRQKTV